MADRKATILHVDDDEANRYAVTRSLVKAGFEVTEAVDGTSALRKAVEGPDLIILDIRLPDIDGFEVCRRIKRDPATADIPVLHLSASFISGEAKAHGLDGGADGYLVRPVEPVELVATVKALLRNKAAEDALRASEEHLRLTVELNPQVPWTAGPDGNVLTISRRWLDLTGLTYEQALGGGWTRAGDPSDLSRVADAWQHSVRTGEPYDVEHRVRLAGGAYRWMRSRAVPHRDGGGRVVRWYGTTEDIDDQKRLGERNAQLLESERAARADAERAGRMKDEFLATLSHELRTPLNAILGWATIIRGSGNDPDDVTQGIEVIERNARAQSQIIEDLLDMSRIISGKVRLDVQRVDLAAIVTAAVATARPTAEAKGVQLAAVIDPLHGVAINGDASRLQQVLWNLLSNAVKFTPKGGRVQVMLARVNSHLEISIIDTGEGIGTEFLPYVFDRFRQADASTTRRHGGLGLGLSIVKQLVELHGGSIRAQSGGSGLGTSFVVVLPLTSLRADTEPEEDRRHPRVPADPGKPPSACPDLSDLRVLVVDDEADARGVVKRLLEDCHAIVTATGSVDEAVELVSTGQFDVLVSDIGMPGDDGYSLLRRVRRLGSRTGSNIPAIALTAYARVEDRVRAIAAGFQMHVAKPVESVELVTMVAGAAGRTVDRRV